MTVEFQTGVRVFPRLWEYICKHIGESDITFIMGNFRSSKKGKVVVRAKHSLGSLT